MSSGYNIYSTTQEAWDAMYLAIQEAKVSVYWEVYIFKDDDIGKIFFDLLIEKARQGLVVKLIIDAFGGFSVGQKRILELRSRGVDVRMFFEKKRRYANWWRQLYVRMHRKILIIDNEIGFIGGVNIDKQMAPWLDIHLRVVGSVVSDLLHSFATTYVISGGEKFSVRHLFRRRIRKAKFIDVNLKSSSEFVEDAPYKNRSRVRKRYAEMINNAKTSVFLFTPYYFPDRHLLRAIWKARKRGVQIDLLIPLRTDVRLASYAANAGFHILEKYGVKIHFLKKMMHGKGVIVDDETAIVGSSNLDQTSFYDNYEANIHIHDSQTVGRLKTIINSWLESTELYDGKRWRKRGWLRKLKELTAFALVSLWHRGFWRRRK